MQVLVLTGPDAIEFEEIEFEAIQSLFERAKAKLLDRIDELKENSDDDDDHDPAPHPPRTEIKLPFLKITPFSGDYHSWKSFRDLFLSAIGDRRDLTGAQKLHYLKSFLEGEAAQLVRSYSVVDGNYRVAWEALDMRYNNKRLLVNALFKRLFGQHAVVGDSAPKLRQLLDTTAECVAALKAHELPTDHWDAVIVYIVVQRLDAETHKQWEMSLTDNDISSFEDLVKFMEKRCRALEAIAGSSSATARSATSTIRPATNNQQRSSSSRSSVNHVTVNPFNACSLCDQNHNIINCRQFKNMSVDERRDAVQRRRMCYICMQRGHRSADCTHQSCSSCSGRHHEMLHVGSAMRSSSTGATTTTVADTVSNSVQSNFVHSTPRKIQVLLSTAWVTINESTERVRVLVDQGSHASLIRESCVQRLGLQRRRISVPIHGIGGAPAGTATSMVNIKIKSCIDHNLVFDVSALVLRKLTGLLPSHQVSFANRPKFVGLQLADPKYYEPGEIDVVLGADVYGLMMLDGIITGSADAGRERPTAQNTALGWLLSGPITMNEAGRHSKIDQFSGQHATVSMHLDVEWNLRKFWEVEEVFDANLHTHAETLAEQHFVETHRRDESGRYIVRLPFSTTPDAALGDSRCAALRRLRSIQRRLNQQPDLQAQYSQFLSEYAAMGHMRIAEQPARRAAYYLPHHFVVKESSSTTRLRVVFDASCKTSSGRSLNDVQLIGPKLQDDLAALVMRFRRHAVALTADIAKMYRQVTVHEDDRDYQRILWQDATSAQVQEWQLTTVTYGMAASPFLAVRALHQLAIDEGRDFPRAARVVLSDFYVDDLITGCDSSADAIELQKELGGLMSRGGFELRKWSSNCAQTLDTIPDNLRESTTPLNLNEDASIKTLGLLWNPAGDYFSFQVSTPVCDDQPTKRSILSVVARLFDPLGLLAPTVIVAKIIIQRLWTSGITWDEDVPEPIRRTWTRYHQTLTALQEIKFSRWIGTRDSVRMQFHGFADASEAAYGGVIYVRCEMPDGHVRVSLLTAKTRVAPLKQVTLPRLELCAAALLTKLFKNVMATFGLVASDYIMWSDSQVALGWMRKEPRQWKTFVANRVAVIQEVTTPDRWRYVCSADNPADCLSRGVMPMELIDHPLWMHGPPWLKADEADWPSSEVSCETSIDERPAATSVLLARVEDDNEKLAILERFSSLSRLQHVTALMSRFMHNCRVRADSRQYGHVTTKELQDGMLLWIRNVQAADFADELQSCRRAINLQKSSKLISLHPFIDEKGILRVGGRLRHAAISREMAHPAILSSSSHLTSLIIDNAHKSLMHGGVQLMLTHIRQRFWIVGAKRRLRTFVHSCIICYRQRPRCAAQQMGDLPELRVTPGRAFLRSGVDYAGPLAYKSRSGRGSRAEKGYVALFVCLATRALHLELVTDLSTDAFIAAFRRFVARRGRCALLMSDNATNFVGAKRKLYEFTHSSQNSDEIAKLLANDGTEWRTIPPRSPHFGGLWEAGVKAVKFHLKRIIGVHLLTYEEFSTVLAQIEAILNSRPLCAVSDDPDDLDVLTPMHFLIGGAPTLVPDEDVLDVQMNRLTRWQLISQITQHFWRRWHKEYLTTLQNRYKWKSVADNVQVGQLVLLKDDLMPPARWKMARVTQTQPGADGRVRVVTLKHATGETTRAITRICILPIKT